MPRSPVYSILVFLIVLSCSLHAQQTSTIWRFGNSCGIDFNSGAPVNLPLGPMNTFEGCTSVCNSGGALLFYTNGVDVYDRNNNLMPNSGLLGGASATMTLAVQKPGDCSRYYLFYAEDHISGGHSFFYSEVDMCLNNGLGDVVNATKNTLLHTNTSEKITAVQHSNGTDVWIITHELNGSAVFNAYLLTAAGVSPAVSTTIGSAHATNCLIGYMKANPTGNKIAVANSFCTLSELFDFNNTTGVLSNYIDLVAQYGIANGAYGIEFSPNSNLLYISTFWGTDYLYQIDLTTSTLTTVATMGGNYEYGALQLAPDGKIYLARTNHTFIDVINNPNTPGMGCGYATPAFALTAGSTCQLGLPNYLPYQAMNQPAPMPVFVSNDTTINCGAPYTMTAPAQCGATYLWQNGSASQTFTASASGQYWVEVSSPCGVGRDTINITTSNQPPVVTVTGNLQICAGQNTTITGNGAVNYTWLPSNTAGSSITLAPASTSSYQVIGSDNCGSDTISFTITVDSIPIITASNDTSVCSGDTIQLSASGGMSYTWSGAVNASGQTITVSPASSGNYIVTGYMDNCPGIPDTVTISMLPMPQVSLTGDSMPCAGETITLAASGSGNFFWPANAVFADSIQVTPLDTTTYTVVSSNSCGSDTAAFTVNTISSVAAQYSVMQDYCSKEIRFIDSSQGASNWLWNFGDGQSSTASAPVHNYEMTGVYFSQLIINPSRPCTDTASLMVSFDNNEYGDVYIPNAFTPNGDGFNEVFSIIGPSECYFEKLMIFDRWGEMIFETDQPYSKSWDGTYKGTLVPEGIYVYRLVSPDFKARRGTIALIR